MRKVMETFIKLRYWEEKVTVTKQCGRKTDELREIERPYLSL